MIRVRVRTFYFETVHSVFSLSMDNSFELHAETLGIGSYDTNKYFVEVFQPKILLTISSLAICLSRIPRFWLVCMTW